MMSFTTGDARNGLGRWYELFSRGTRDWLRHNEKVRQAVRDHLPELVAGSDVLTNARDRTVKVPVRFMEHYRFRLREADETQGAGQGKAAQPGDVLRPARPVSGSDPGAGEGEGQVSFALEFQIDDILDWLWEDLKLPNLRPREGASVEEDDYVREGWDKRGARSRLDRRRTLREAVKRRGAHPDSAAVPIGNDDLRFRQLARRRKPATNAVVVFVLDVSSSMDEHCRKLAKTFFFWALQGIRRQYTSVEAVFVAHTMDAWEFAEAQFFQVRGEGGTKSSTGFAKAREILAERYDPARYNSYLFYATDGHNFSEDRAAASAELARLLPDLNFAGYAEVSQQAHRHMDTEVGAIWRRLANDDQPVGSYIMTTENDIWPAIKAFFTDQAERSGVA
jgi:hypothetical protein